MEQKALNGDKHSLTFVMNVTIHQYQDVKIISSLCSISTTPWRHMARVQRTL